GLKIIELIERGRAKYMGETYLRDGELLNTIKQLSKREQQTIAELIAGDLIVHNCYVGKSNDTIAGLEELRNVPSYFLYPPQNLAEIIEKRAGQPVTIKDQMFDANIQFMQGKYTGSIFRHLDGDMSLWEIFDGVRKDAGLSEQELSNEALLEEFRQIYQQFNNV